jgi:hypothetical protein
MADKDLSGQFLVVDLKQTVFRVDPEKKKLTVSGSPHISACVLNPELSIIPKTGISKVFHKISGVDIRVIPSMPSADVLVNYGRSYIFINSNHHRLDQSTIRSSELYYVKKDGSLESIVPVDYEALLSRMSENYSEEPVQLGLKEVSRIIGHTPETQEKLDALHGSGHGIEKEQYSFPSIFHSDKQVEDAVFSSKDGRVSEFGGHRFIMMIEMDQLRITLDEIIKNNLNFSKEGLIYDRQKRNCAHYVFQVLTGTASTEEGLETQQIIRNLFKEIIKHPETLKSLQNAVERLQLDIPIGIEGYNKYPAIESTPTP